MLLQSRMNAMKAIVLNVNPAINEYKTPRINWHNVWQQLAGIFHPYNVNVCTFPPTIWPRNQLHVNFTYIVNLPGMPSDLKGSSILGGYRTQTDFKICPVYVWCERMNEIEIVRTAAHEIGHALGADHSDEPNSIMHPELGSGYGFIDKATHNAIRSVFDIAYI